MDILKKYKAGDKVLSKGEVFEFLCDCYVNDGFMVLARADVGEWDVISAKASEVSAIIELSEKDDLMNENQDPQTVEEPVMTMDVKDINKLNNLRAAFDLPPLHEEVTALIDKQYRYDIEEALTASHALAMIESGNRLFRDALGEDEILDVHVVNRFKTNGDFYRRIELTPAEIEAQEVLELSAELQSAFRNLAWVEIADKLVKIGVTADKFRA